MMTNQPPPDEEIHEQMHPAPADVAVAKEFIAARASAAEGSLETMPLVRAYLEDIDENPGLYHVGGSQHEQVSLNDLIAHARWVNAAQQGMAELEGLGLLLPEARGKFSASSPTVTVRTQHQAHGVQCDHYNFELAQAYLASSAATQRSGNGFLLRDPDLYLNRIDAEKMHPRVAASLVEAVACYRTMLHLGAAVLLGAASEGAWLELANAFASYCERTDTNIPKNLRDEVDSETPRLERVQRSLGQALRQEPELLRAAGVKRGALESLTQTADSYRHFRNYTVHFREDGLEQIDYSTVGVLLLNGTRYFNSIYRLKSMLDR